MATLVAASYVSRGLFCSGGSGRSLFSSGTGKVLNDEEKAVEKAYFKAFVVVDSRSKKTHLYGIFPAAILICVSIFHQFSLHAKLQRETIKLENGHKPECGGGN